MTKKIFSKIIVEGLGILSTLVILIPFYMLIVNSFKNKAEASELSIKLPNVWNIIENYSTVIKIGKMFSGFKNSLIITFFSVLLIILVTAFSGFIIQRRKCKITELIFSIIMIGLIVPASMVPVYFVVNFLQLSGTHLGVSLVYTANYFPLGVFLFVGFYKSISREIDEAAIIDGAKKLTLFAEIIFPLVKPATISVLIISFMGIWNDFVVPIFLISSPKKMSVVISMYLFFGEKASDWNLVFATIIVVSLPVIILYFLLQKHIVSGMTAGAVKG